MLEVNDSIVQENLSKVLSCYELGVKLSENLHPCNVHKVGLLLNLSVFYFEN